MEQKRGGILSASCVGDLTRNTLQASQIRCKKKTNHEAGVANSKFNDPVQALVVSPDHCVQLIRLVPNPTIILFNDTQLNDMEQFCALSYKASVLGIDITFIIGRFCVTLCTYQNLKVAYEQGRHPIMVGRGLIHLKTSPNLTYFFRKLQTESHITESLWYRW